MQEVQEIHADLLCTDRRQDVAILHHGKHQSLIKRDLQIRETRMDRNGHVGYQLGKVILPAAIGHTDIREPKKHLH